MPRGSLGLKEVMQSRTCHEAIKSLSWLIGRWKSIKGEGFYPTIKPFNYNSEIAFESKGQPLLNYNLDTWDPVNGNFIHLERGFLRINPGTDQVAFMVAHGLGVVTLEEGKILDYEVRCKSTQLASMSFVRDPHTVAIERVMKLNSKGNLEVIVNMATVKTALTPHLFSVYEYAGN